MAEPVRTAIVGCGFISEVYAATLYASPDVDLVACADLQPERAQARAAQCAGARAAGVDEVLADPGVELVVNLTVPRAHYEVTEAALLAGKSVFSEKPLALDPAAAERLLALARTNGVLLGCAPDTFMGAGLQTAFATLASGAIGEPVHAVGTLQFDGPDAWHPDPAFLFQEGSGPLLDVGPYFVTALVAALGCVTAVSGVTRQHRAEREVGSGPLAGTTFPVTVPTHVAAILEFEGPTIATLTTSFDVGTPYTSSLELHGTAGSLRLPDPNGFDGPVLVRRGPATEWADVPLLAGAGSARGTGAVDLARALRTDGTPAASGDLAAHVLDVLHAVIESGRAGRRVEVSSRCPRPAPVTAIGAGAAS
ncbi:MAG: hypothetical protein QOE45_2556 [Frankiaceae bacterium]|nr:hypothetical protein [Frankiaceae bacterium]